ncbi:MAG: hypothetical protein RIE86_00790 [Imperialibacter sp.]|uniref:hypothetical protein n=1 Tax=Imperialibacter sp. TaxID=2038411 RepID=UPI0032EB7CCB
MDKTTKIVIGVLIISVLAFFGMDFICQLGTKCKNCPQYSNSIEDSKNNGFFIAEYQPTKKYIKLLHYQDSVFFSNAWVESSWSINSDICLLKSKEKSDRFNITVEFNKQTDDFIFNLRGYGSGFGLGTNSKTVTTSELTDTLTFTIVEKNPEPGIGWRAELQGSTIQFALIK